jgi:monoterpene epsilon-lactone hydrolase
LIATKCIESGLVLLHAERDFVPIIEHLGLRSVFDPEHTFCLGASRHSTRSTERKAKDCTSMTAEIDAVRALLQSRPRPATWAERRERLDSIGSVYPPPSDIRIEPAELGGVPAEWSLAPGSDPSRVLIFLHGGGYCSGSIASHRGMVTETGRSAGVRTLALGYRLAPEHPFPAALDDALAAYADLLGQGIDPARIALAGDSAGGGLALATMLRLREAGQPLPACAWLVSPWVDLQMTGGTMASKAEVDPLIQKAYLQQLAASYLAGADPAQPCVSPLNADLGGFPPLLVQVGSAETLLDDAVRIAGRAGAANVPVTLEVWPQMIHVWHLWAAQLRDGRCAIASAGAFIRARLSA